MAKFKDYIKIFIACLISAVVTLTIQSWTTRNDKIVNAASKDDVECVKYEMTEYTDKSKKEAIEYTANRFEQHDKIHDKQDEANQEILRQLDILVKHALDNKN